MFVYGKRKKTCFIMLADFVCGMCCSLSFTLSSKGERALEFMISINKFLRSGGWLGFWSDFGLCFVRRRFLTIR